ncbi:hypothetical protein PMF13cell1_00685 [Blautia producta]|uniref:Uncharacterized protein n=1 Tax=Blautia producta TaxID=33035 RepID=A0A4P6LTI4_9FIRM|nr:hypothetical protein [Blautia producta]QBE95182.1 hypothetical protein PMF13cell1_00685 [Blautia producta]
MIVKIAFSVFGLILSIYGIYHLIKSEKNQNDYKKYGTYAYIGLALFVFLLILIFQLHKQFNLLLIMVVVSIVFVILGKILLSPGFRKDKDDISG